MPYTVWPHAKNLFQSKKARVFLTCFLEVPLGKISVDLSCFFGDWGTSTHKDPLKFTRTQKRRNSTDNPHVTSWTNQSRWIKFMHTLLHSGDCNLLSDWGTQIWTDQTQIQPKKCFGSNLDAFASNGCKTCLLLHLTTGIYFNNVWFIHPTRNVCAFKVILFNGVHYALMNYGSMFSFGAVFVTNMILY